MTIRIQEYIRKKIKSAEIEVKYIQEQLNEFEDMERGLARFEIAQFNFLEGKEIQLLDIIEEYKQDIVDMGGSYDDTDTRK